MAFLNENGLSRLWMHIIAKLGNKSNIDHTHTPESIGADASGSAANALSNAKNYTDNKIDQLVNGAPGTMDTLYELSQAIAENEDVVDALNSAIGTKANKTDLEAVSAVANDALPKSGGTMSGQLNIGTVNNEASVVLQFGRKLDETTKASSQSYLTASGIYKTDVVVGGVATNSLSLDKTETRLGKPLAIQSGGHGGTTAEEARTNLEITPINIGAVPMEGGKMTGALTIGTKTETANVPLTISRKGTDDAGYEMQLGISDGDAAVVMLYQTTESGITVPNRMVLDTDNTSFKVPVDILGGGTGANNAADARANLEITPANIGALATTGGKMTGTLTVGSNTSRNSVPVTVSRLGTDGTTKYEMLHGITDGDEASIIFYQNGAHVNRMILGDDRTTFGVPVDIAGGGTGASNAADARVNLGVASQEDVDNLSNLVGDIDTRVQAVETVVGDGSIFLTDIVNGYTYIIQMENGSLTSRLQCSRIFIATDPNKTKYYEGEAFDPTGMVVMAEYPDGTSSEITNYTYSEISEEGIVTITYKQGSEFTTTFNVTSAVFDPEVELVDFAYTANDDGTYTITDWDGTTNGVAGTEIVLPDASVVRL